MSPELFVHLLSKLAMDAPCDNRVKYSPRKHTYQWARNNKTDQAHCCITEPGFLQVYLFLLPFLYLRISTQLCPLSTYPVHVLFSRTYLTYCAYRSIQRNIETSYDKGMFWFPISSQLFPCSSQKNGLSSLRPHTIARTILSVSFITTFAISIVISTYVFSWFTELYFNAFGK